MGGSERNRSAGKGEEDMKIYWLWWVPRGELIVHMATLYFAEIYMYNSLNSIHLPRSIILTRKRELLTSFIQPYSFFVLAIVLQAHSGCVCQRYNVEEIRQVKKPFIF